VKTAQVLYRAVHTPCGETVVEIGSRESLDYTFTGYERNDALSMFDAGARFYDPVLCRMIGVDPIAAAEIYTSKTIERIRSRYCSHDR